MGLKQKQADLSSKLLDASNAAQLVRMLEHEGGSLDDHARDDVERLVEAVEELREMMWGAS